MKQLPIKKLVPKIIPSSKAPIVKHPPAPPPKQRGE
jgi:hypothetical protein